MSQEQNVNELKSLINKVGAVFGRSVFRISSYSARKTTQGLKKVGKKSVQSIKAFVKKNVRLKKNREIVNGSSLTFSKADWLSNEKEISSSFQRKRIPFFVTEGEEKVYLHFDKKDATKIHEIFQRKFQNIFSKKNENVLKNGIKKARDTIKKMIRNSGKTIKISGRTVKNSGAVMEKTGYGVQRSGDGISSVGKAISTTGIGSVIGVPVIVGGKVISTLGAASRVSGKNVKQTGRSMERGGEKIENRGRERQSLSL